MTRCSSQTARGSVSPSSRHVRLESKGLCVNTKKSMVPGIDLDVLKKSGKCARTVCCKGVGINSPGCSQCKLWLCKKRTGITGRLVADPNYICPRCNGKSRTINGRPMISVNVDDNKLDVDATFCYLGDMLCHCHKMRCGLGKVQEIIACPHLQAPLS